MVQYAAEHNLILSEAMERVSWDDMLYYMAYKKVASREERQRAAKERTRAQAHAHSQRPAVPPARHGARGRRK